MNKKKKRDNGSVGSRKEILLITAGVLGVIGLFNMDGISGAVTASATATGESIGPLAAVIGLVTILVITIVFKNG